MEWRKPSTDSVVKMVPELQDRSFWIRKTHSSSTNENRTTLVHFIGKFIKGGAVRGMFSI